VYFGSVTVLLPKTPKPLFSKKYENKSINSKMKKVYFFFNIYIENLLWENLNAPTANIYNSIVPCNTNLNGESVLIII
jgi:hypothetical protein